MAAVNNTDPQDRSIKSFIKKNLAYVAAAVIIVLVSPVVGHSIAENDGRKGIDWMGTLDSLNDYLTVSGFFESVGAAVNGGEYESKAVVYGLLIGAAVIFAGAFSPKKRTHRKGVEHGSAHWGTEEEKRIIRDNNDFSITP